MAVLYGQLTVDQKIADFEYTAGVLAKRYGPYEWKRDALGVDLFDTERWLAKIRATKTDLEFYDVMSEYAASLNDAHTVYVLPSNYVANLHFAVDIYDGKLLVDFINRTRLPASEYGFTIGYELVSIDGEDANRILERFLRYNVAANPRSTRRFAAQAITIRQQAVIPSAPDVPEMSTVVFRRPDGATETYRLPWARSGFAFGSPGKHSMPSARKTEQGEPSEQSPAWMEPLERLWNIRLPVRAVLNYGSATPVFANGFPGSLAVRLGRNAADPFFSGVYESDGYKIGFIRIPSFSPGDLNTAVGLFAREIAHFQANTDGLVVDVTRNPGGSVLYTNTLLSLLMTQEWRSIPFEVRANSDWISSFSNSLESAKTQRAPEWIIRQIQATLDHLIEANRGNRGRTPAIPLDDTATERQPAKDDKGAVIAYTKPLIVLTDEMSASGGDYFPATIQDNERGKVVGWRTMGAGGSVSPWGAGAFSYGQINVTESLMVRKNVVNAEGFPLAPYVENVGVTPDIPIDYMTRDNLFQRGKPFVDSFTAAIVEQIRSAQ